MDFSIKQALGVLVVIVCAVAVVGTAIALTNKNNTQATTKNDNLWNTIGNVDANGNISH